MDEDHVVLAAEWALGTLNADELERAQALIGSEPEFATMVRDWERRLGELNALVSPIEPPADLLDRIKARIAGTAQGTVIQLPESAPARDAGELPASEPHPEATPELRAVRSADGGAQHSNEQRARIVYLTRRMRRWQEIAAAFATLAAMIAGVFVTSLVRPDLMPEQMRPKPRVVEVIKTVEVQVPAKAPERENRFTAVLQHDSTSPAFILTVDLNERTMTVRRVSAENPVGKSYELWLVSRRFPAPRSLGVVQPGEFSQPVQLASFEPDTIREATYAISLEPEGGSPTGTVTSPILWTGQLIETTPPARAN